MKEHHIRIGKMARYFTLGHAGDSVEQVWFVCHGYGQSASSFLKNFDAFNDSTHLIVAPEALSRFYWQGFSGDVGASWMTREDRLNEIQDYVSYLDDVHDRIFTQVDRASVKIVVLGFSQGTSTVCRWITHGKVTCEQLILWAGVIPPDLDLKQKEDIFGKLKLTFVVGSKDEIASPKAVAHEKQRLERDGFPYQWLSFDGGHRLDSEILKKISNRL
ncbi:MAG: alpha/beta hydrolase [bacterium]